MKHWISAEPFHFHSLAMMMYFKALKDMGTAASCSFIPILPLTVPKSAVKSAKKDPGTMDFVLCEDSRGVIQVLNSPPVFII